MDVYHQVLVKLYDATEGREKPVNLKDLVKELGLHGNYQDILERLSGEGWVAERGADLAVITQWGVKEARKAKENPTDAKDKRQKIVREANRSINLAQELIALLENQVQNPDENFSEGFKKSAELQNSITTLKNNLS